MKLQDSEKVAIYLEMGVLVLLMTTVSIDRLDISNNHLILHRVEIHDHRTISKTELIVLCDFLHVRLVQVRIRHNVPRV